MEAIEAIAPPIWKLLRDCDMNIFPKRNEVVAAVWSQDRTTAVVVRYVCPPDENPEFAVWHGIEEGATMQKPFAWRHLQANEWREFNL